MTSWRHMVTQSWSTLFQLMACCLTAPSHYLNQYTLQFYVALVHRETMVCTLCLSIFLWYHHHPIILRIVVIIMLMVITPDEGNNDYEAGNNGDKNSEEEEMKGIGNYSVLYDWLRIWLSRWLMITVIMSDFYYWMILKVMWWIK